MNLAAAMLADAARVEENKLYIHGGGFDTIWATTYPATHPTLSVVLLVMVDWDEALNPIQINVALLDEDDNRLGPGFSGVINVGHPATSTRGMPIPVAQQATLPFLQFPAPGAYRFRISSGEQELGSIRFRVALPPNFSGPIGAPPTPAT